MYKYIYCTIGGELTWPRTSVCSTWSYFWNEENLHGMIALGRYYKIACTADRRGSTMNSVIILYYNNIICAMRRFCLIGFLLPI